MMTSDVIGICSCISKCVDESRICDFLPEDSTIQDGSQTLTNIMALTSGEEEYKRKRSIKTTCRSTIVVD